MPPRSSSPPLQVATPALHDKLLRMSYRIARGEQGVLTFEPYKSTLLPHWRFRTVPIARASAAVLWRHFVAFEAAGDFVGMDMARKFIQMGCTRAARYANYKGGKKYEESSADGGGRVQKARSEGHEGREEKREASEVFRAVWKRCRESEGYGRLREEFRKEQGEWDRGGGKTDVGAGGVKDEELVVKWERDESKEEEAIQSTEEAGERHKREAPHRKTTKVDNLAVARKPRTRTRVATGIKKE